ncbi:Hypothetical protein HVR_LOCUS996 [uncultured virus]|nr:Hypothetical protein HVR_LOCUS996 [uncultured virus]
MLGKLRVGRSKYINGKVILPQYPGFTQIVVLTKSSSPYGDLGPYHLKNGQGQILENIHQFSKVYQTVPKVSIPYSSGNSRIVWNWPAEIHIDSNGNSTNEYWKWRTTGKNNKEPVRNPVGWSHLKNCLFALEKDEPLSESNPKLDYIESRKRIYLPIYMRAVVKEPSFWELRNRRLNGENLLIIEVDGPHQESLNYYKDKYNVGDDFIEKDSVEATESNLAILLNDPKHPFGHGYCLAWSLSR